jgi:biopolymer transport protein ExbD
MGGANPMVDINTTPLVDVMLVLLIIFMITAPLLTHRVAIVLPQQTPIEQRDLSKVEPRQLELRSTGSAVEIRVDGELISQEQLFAEFRAVGAKIPDEQNKYKIEADESVPYSDLASILAAAKRSHVERIGFENLGSPQEAQQP